MWKRMRMPIVVRPNVRGGIRHNQRSSAKDRRNEHKIMKKMECTNTL